MSAVWAVTRAAVRRRKLQTFVIGLVILLSSATLVFALGLLDAANTPFDDAFAAADGAHVSVAYDPAKVTDAQLQATAHAPGVTAAAGPFRTAVLPGMLSADQEYGLRGGDLLVGRADPNGPVDKVTLQAGHWPTKDGELVVSADVGDTNLIGTRFTSTTPGLPALTVVGVAVSVTGTAGGWVTPSQLAAYPSQGSQMLYRFSDAGSDARLATALSRATAGLPPGAVRGSETYLLAKRNFQEQFNQILPFVTIFGVLGAIISVMIIGNVVSGAVVSGFRHIGIMKAIGFTPRQVTSVYVGMIAVPGLAGCVIGTAAGHELASMLIRSLKKGLALPPSSAGVGIQVDVVAALGVILVVGVTALIPAMRAGRLSAVRAISPVASSRGGRGRTVQRRLARTALPSPVSLGLSLPFARPGRTALTLAAVTLGALAATFGLGLHNSVMKIAGSTHEAGDVQVFNPPPGFHGETPGKTRLTDAQVMARLSSIPGTQAVLASTNADGIRVAGTAAPVDMTVYRGDGQQVYGGQLARGRWLRGSGEVLVSEGFLRSRHHHLGDMLQLEAGNHVVEARIVGTLFTPKDDKLATELSTLTPALPKLAADQYDITLQRGTSAAAYLSALQRATDGTGLLVEPPQGGDTVVFDALFFTFTLFLCVSAGLGVLNTVVLNTRERARDLGVLKSIGMTPRQVVAMVVTSMTALGVVGTALGVPLGVLTHHAVLAYTGTLIQAGMPGRFVSAYGVVLLALLALSGPAIGALGALLPATWAARLKTAAALHSE